MKSVSRLLLPILFILVIDVLVITTPSSALKPIASIEIAKPMLFGVSIPYGQKIAVYIEIHVDKNSPVPLVNPYIFITLVKPNGQQITVKKLIKDKINPNEIKGYNLKLDCVADMPGTWKYKVELWVFIRNKWYKLDEKVGTFVVHAIPKAEIIIIDIGNNKAVIYGQKITFKIKVCVKKDSPVPLDGFYALVLLDKPNGKQVRIDINRNDKIKPGECKEYIITSNCVADQIGTWKFRVILFTKDEEHSLDEKKVTFEVYGIPKAHIEYIKIYSYTATASMICAGLALILSRIIR